MDYRDFLVSLEKMEELKRVKKKKVDPRFEMAAVMKRLEREEGPAVLFEAVKGHPGMSVAANLFSTRKRIAFSIGAEGERFVAQSIISKMEKAPEEAKACRIVKSGSVKDVVNTGKKASLSKLPILTHCEKDGGPYISAGVVVSKDPESKKRAIQVIEIHVKGPQKLNISPVTPPILFSYAKAEEKNKALETAIVIGVDPEIMLAACAPSAIAAGMDKFEIAGAFKGEPVDLVKCETVDLEVPANAEIVIEGAILPKVREDMGPYGDYLKTYYWKEKKPVMKISAITHRKNPIYQALLCDGIETPLLLAIPFEISLLKNLPLQFPFVREVHVTTNSGGFHHAVVSIKKRMDEDARYLILHLLSNFVLKHVVVVDDDIDVFNLNDVEWAITCRVQADKDVILIPNMTAIPLDPSAREGITAKMGIDATRSLKVPAERYERSDVPKKIREKVDREWNKYFA